MSPIALFDLDNTLIDRSAAFRRWATWFAEGAGLGVADVDWIVAAEHDGYAPRDELFHGIRERFGLGESVERLVAGYERHYPGFVVTDPAVNESLRRMREAGWRIAIVTNGGALQRVKVERAGLTDLVDACCVSAELDSWKPDARIFEVAMAACGADGPSCRGAWMVGDSADHDMVGAHALGMGTVWMDRGRPWTIEAFEPDHRAATIPAAVELLLASDPPAGTDGSVRTVG